MPDMNPVNWAQGVQIFADCITPRKPCLTVSIVNDKLRDVDLILNYDNSIGNAIQYLGNPDHTGFEPGDTPRFACRVNLIWSDKQLLLASDIFYRDDVYKYCYAARDAGKVAS